MVSLFDISGWYHRIWCILYNNKVIKDNAMHTRPGSVGVACSPMLLVSFKGMGCEPVLNLAATPDDAVSIICNFVDKSIPSTLGEVDVWAITDRPSVSVGHYADALDIIIICGFFGMVDLCSYDALSIWRHSWTDTLSWCLLSNIHSSPAMSSALVGRDPWSLLYIRLACPWCWRPCGVTTMQLAVKKIVAHPWSRAFWPWPLLACFLIVVLIVVQPLHAFCMTAIVHVACLRSQPSRPWLQLARFPTFVACPRCLVPLLTVTTVGLL